MKKLLLLLLFVPAFGLAQNLPDYVPASGLAAFYTFDGNANDSSTNQNNGTVHGAVLSEDRNLNPNSSYFFDGQDDYIDMGLDNSLQIQIHFLLQFGLKRWAEAVILAFLNQRIIVVVVAVTH